MDSGNHAMAVPKPPRIVLLGLFLILSGCAAHYTTESIADPYGFFSGIWHGIVFPLALLANVLSWLLGIFGISFLDSIQIIGRPNTGFWYYTGFVLGFVTYSTAAS